MPFFKVIFVLLFGLLAGCVTDMSGPNTEGAGEGISISSRSDWRYLNASAMRTDPAFRNAGWPCDRWQEAAVSIRSGAFDGPLQRPGADRAVRNRSTGETRNVRPYADVIELFGDRSACAFRSDRAMTEFAATMAYLAELDAFRGPKEFDGNTSLGVWAITNSAQSHAATRPYYPAEYRANVPAIDAWLTRRINGLIRGTDRPCPSETDGRLTNDSCNNVDLRIQYAMTALGAATANDAYLTRGAAAIRKHLGTMRQDGSLAADSRRGCRALLYSMDSYGFMIGIADILREHGYDAYVTNSNGASIRKGIAFAVSVVDDNSQIMGYARGRTGPNTSDGCADGRPFRASLDLFEWAYPFILDFPEDPLSRRIRPVIDADGKRSSTLYSVAPYLYARY